MATLYYTASGSVTKQMPYFFTERDLMIACAKSIANNLKYTKKLCKEEFISAYTENPQVKDYRDLLKKIWGFEARDSIVSVKKCCENDKCTNTDNLLEVKNHFIRTRINEEIYYFYETLCPECLKENQDFWADRRIYEVIEPK